MDGNNDKSTNLKSRLTMFFWCLKKAWGINPGGLVINIIITFAGGIIPAAFVSVIGKIINKIPLQVSNQGTFMPVVKLLVILGGFMVFKEIYNTFNEILMSVTYNMYTPKLKRELIRAVENVPVRYFDKAEFCDRLARSNEAAEQMAQLIQAWLSLSSIIITLVSLLVLALSINWIVFIICMISVIVGLYISGKTAHMETDYWEKSAKANRKKSYLFNLCIDPVYAREIRILKLTDYLAKMWIETADWLREEFVRMRSKTTVMFSMVMLVNSLFAVVSLTSGVFLVKYAIITLGGLVQIWQITGMFNMNIQGVTNRLGGFLSYLDRMKYLSEFIENPLDGKILPAEHQKLAVNNNLKENYVFELRDVSFSYEPDKPALKGINLSVPKGQVLAVCGGNGAGKSTLIKILLGLYKPESGWITFKGMPYDVLGTDYISNHIGVAFQDFVRYPLKIRENIGFGNIKQILDDEAILTAADKGRAIEIIQRAGGSLEWYLGRTFDDKGLELSGGEWQRIAVSRSHMSDKEVIILDEPAAKLDPIAELMQMEGIRKMISGRTAVLVSHRMGFARLADRIIVVEDGSIVEDGTHEGLIKLDGEYARMYKEQAQWYENAI